MSAATSFFELYDDQDGLTLDIGHTPVCDYTISVYERVIGGQGKQILYSESCDLNLAFSSAYVQLAEYLSENRGGY